MRPDVLEGIGDLIVTIATEQKGYEDREHGNLAAATWVVYLPSLNLFPHHDRCEL